MVIGLVVITYLVGVFKYSTLELLHSISHQLSGNHSYYSHLKNNANNAHNHAILEFSKNMMDKCSDSPLSRKNTNKSIVDKVSLVCETMILLITYVEITNRQPFSFNEQIPSIPYLQKLSPPPKIG